MLNYGIKEMEKEPVLFKDMHLMLKKLLMEPNKNNYLNFVIILKLMYNLLEIVNIGLQLINVKKIQAI
jgi:hypothetical protein